MPADVPTLLKRLADVEALAAQVRAGRDGRDGRAGPPGPPGSSAEGIPGQDGRDGRDADPQVITDEVRKAIAEIELPAPVAGEPGPPGPVGAPGPMGPMGPAGKDGRDGQNGRDGQAAAPAPARSYVFQVLRGPDGLISGLIASSIEGTVS